MSNLFWYFLLAFIGLASLAYTIYKKRDIYKVSVLLVFALAMASCAWLAEFIILGLFNAYTYRTGLVKDIWAQNLLGHLIINTTLYPSIAIVLVANSLRYYWVFIFAAFFTFLEYMFVKLRVYEQHWWRYYMTFIAVVIFLSVTRKWFAKVKETSLGFTRTITMYFVAMIIIHIPAPVLLLLEKQYYQLSIVNNRIGNLYLSSIIIIFSYHLLEAFLLVFVTCILKYWYFKITPFLISLAAQSLFAKMEILIFEDGWQLVYTLIIYEIFIAFFVLIEKYTLRPEYRFT